MANVKISELPQTTILQSTDLVASVSGSTTTKITVKNLADSLTQVSSSISASVATSAATASYVNNLRQSLIVTGSISITGSVTVNRGGLAVNQSSVTIAGGGLSVSGSTTTILGGLLAGTSFAALGEYSTVLGLGNDATGLGAVAQGNGTIASGDHSHAEGGFSTTAAGFGSHAEGTQTTVQSGADYGHAEGSNTIVAGIGAHAEGESTQAIGDYSHAEGNSTYAYSLAHAEGNNSTALGSGSHAEGWSTLSSGRGSHVEGQSSISEGEFSHAEGRFTKSRGTGSHAEGYFTTASGDYSHAEGFGTVANAAYQHVQGTYNISSSNPGAFIIGNGISHSNRKNLIYASGSAVEISGSLLISGSIIPSVASGSYTSSFSLGSPTNAWKDIYVSDGTIYFTNSTNGQTSTVTVNSGSIVSSGGYGQINSGSTIVHKSAVGTFTGRTDEMSASVIVGPNLKTAAFIPEGYQCYNLFNALAFNNTSSVYLYQISNGVSGSGYATKNPITSSPIRIVNRSGYPIMTIRPNALDTTAILNKNGAELSSIGIPTGSYADFYVELPTADGYSGLYWVLVQTGSLFS